MTPCESEVGKNLVPCSLPLYPEVVNWAWVTAVWYSRYQLEDNFRSHLILFGGSERTLWSEMAGLEARRLRPDLQ